MPGTVGGKLNSFVVYPQRTDKAGVVLVIHDINGMRDIPRALGDQLAEDGFIAIVPDFLSGKGPNGGGSDSLGAGVGQAIRTLTADEMTARLNAAMEYGKKLAASNGKLLLDRSRGRRRHGQKRYGGGQKQGQGPDDAERDTPARRQMSQRQRDQRSQYGAGTEKEMEQIERLALAVAVGVDDQGADADVEQRHSRTDEHVAGHQRPKLRRERREEHAGAEQQRSREQDTAFAEGVDQPTAGQQHDQPAH